jgi:hypothetical protein
MGTTTASLEPCGSVLADVFGIVLKQHRANDEKEWKIGTKIFRRRWQTQSVSGTHNIRERHTASSDSNKLSGKTAA